MPLPERSRRWVGCIALILGAHVFCSATIGRIGPQAGGSPRALPDGVTEAMVLKGREVFNGRGGCFRCHGENGHGSVRAPALDDATRLHLQTASYDEVLARILTGVPKPKRHLFAMPPRGGAALSDEETGAVAAYVFTLDRGS